jgi:hypothetical protein
MGPPDVENETIFTDGTTPRQQEHDQEEGKLIDAHSGLDPRHCSMHASLKMHLISAVEQGSFTTGSATPSPRGSHCRDVFVFKDKRRSFQGKDRSF